MSGSEGGAMKVGVNDDGAMLVLDDDGFAASKFSGKPWVAAIKFSADETFNGSFKPKFALEIRTKLNLWNRLSQFSLSKSVHVNTSATVHKSFET
jgi:hypothetical protein